MAKLGSVLIIAGLCALAVSIPVSDISLKHQSNDVLNGSTTRVTRQLGPKPRWMAGTEALFTLLNPFIRKYCNVNKECGNPEIAIVQLDKKKKGNKCDIDIKTLRRENPLIVDPSDHRELVQPNKRGIITLHERERVFLSCTTESHLVLSNWALSGSRNTITVECVKNTLFKTVEEIPMSFTFKEMKCTDPVPNMVKDMRSGNSVDDETSNDIKPFFIGFDVDVEKKFAPVLGGWTDHNKMVPFWVHNIVTKQASNYKQPVPDSSHLRWKKDACCDPPIDFDLMYKIEEQKRSFYDQFECDSYPDHPTCKFYGTKDEDPQKYEDFFFNRGHLAAQSSFLYTSESAATFAYVNQAPQPYAINRIKWAGVESYTRSLAQMMQETKGMSVFTGTFGQLEWTRPSDGKKQPVYLHMEAHREEIYNYVPIPKYFWKLIIDPIKRKGVVFVTVNNPFLKVDEVEHHHELCTNPKTDLAENVIGQLDERIINRESTYGYTYVCSVPDFMNNEHVKKFPGYETIDLEASKVYFKNWADLLKIKKGKNDMRPGSSNKGNHQVHDSGDFK